LWCSNLTLPIMSTLTGTVRSKDRANARGRQYRDDVHNAWRLQVCERLA